MKKAFLLMVLVLSVVCGFAQMRWGGPELVRPRINIDANFAIPSGERGSDYGYAWGASLGIDVPVTHSLYGTITGGYTSFEQGGKAAYVNSRSYISAKAGAKLYLTPFWYAQGELGVAFGIQQGAGSVFIVSPGTGVSLHITERSAINLGVRYESWRREKGNINTTAFKVGYQF